jgi:phosphatidylserine/phosphatidylglycerophosphate/cardiolipin synthase-like enzyme
MLYKRNNISGINKLSALNVDISFLGNDFHSKFFLFYKQKELIGGVIGSSNFTSGGLVKNIETNILIKDNDTLKELQKHFDELLQNSNIQVYLTI